MSHPHESTHEDGSDSTAVSPLSISTELAEKAEDLLREFAEEAELGMALIVNRDASLLAGISSEENVAVEEISALVAGASSAVKALVQELGETGAVESLHQGGERIVYLHDLLGRFILVGVSAAGLPIGIIRQQAVPVRAKLTEMLKDVEGAAEIEPPEQVQRSLRISDLLRDTRKEEENEHQAEDEFTEEVEIPVAEEQAAVEVEEELDSQVQIDDPPADTTENEEDAQDEDEVTVELETSSTGNKEESKLKESIEEQIEASEPDEAETPEEKPRRPATIVVDSPFEAVIEEEEEDSIEIEEPPVIADNWGGSEEEIEIIDETKPVVKEVPPESTDEAGGMPTPEPVEISPEIVVGEPANPAEEEERSEDEPAPRKAGPKYSFDLG